MPYKTGKLKGELTLPELRKLVKAHNKLQTIKIPAGINRDGMIKLIEDNGFDINHKAQSIVPRTRPRRQEISVTRAKKILAEKPKLTAIQQQKQDERKAKALATKKKKEREKKKQIIEEQKKIQKKKDEKKKPPSKPKPAVKKPPSKPKVAYKDLTKDVVSTTYGKKKPPVKKPKDIKPPSTTTRKPRRTQTQADKVETDMIKKYQGKSAVQKNPDMNLIEVNNVKDGILTAKQYADIRDVPAQAIYDNLRSNASPIFFPWSSFQKSELISLTYILKNNSNDCSVSESLMKYISHHRQQRKGKSTNMINPNKNIQDMAISIAEAIANCWKNGKKAVCIPISITQAKKKGGTSHHANMLIFNPFMMEAEHFEPHGQEFHGTGKRDEKGKWQWSKVTGINLSDGIKEVNKMLKAYQKDFFNDKGGFKYLNPADICPRNIKKYKSFQLRDSYRQNITRDFNGVVITEIGGYCAMWSLFYLDMRLKTLRKPVQSIYKQMAKFFKKDYADKDDSTFIHLMRGMSKFAWEQQYNMVKKGYLSEQALIGMLGKTAEEDSWKKYSKQYYEAVDKYVIDDWKTFTKNAGV